MTHPLQHYLDGLSAQWQKERAEQQMTLCELISALSAVPGDTPVTNLHRAHSYRGYYIDLAFEQGDGVRPASELLAECHKAMGAVFQGYKGGDYPMHANTPIWVADYGSTGKKLMSIIPFVVADER